MKSSLKLELAAGIIAIVIISMVSSTLLFVSDARTMLLSELNSRGELIIQSLKGVAIEQLLKKDYLALNDYVKKAAATKGVSYIIVTDAYGVIRASNDPMRFSEKSAADYKKYVDSKDTINFSDKLNVKEKNLVIPAGKIFAGFEKKIIDDKIMAIYIRSGAVALGIMILSIILILLITRRITQPLESLIKGTKIIAEGNLRHKIEVKTGNELNDLASSFNMMTDKLGDYYEGVLTAFTMALDTKDKYTPGHSLRVANNAVKLGKAMNLTQKQIENLRLAGILKDIGYIGIDQTILEKPEPLSDIDFLEIKRHPDLSAKIIQPIDNLKDIIQIILQHHERYDGKGYPKGLKGDMINTEAKILFITDAYDAMITQRKHRPAMSKEEAVYELRQNKGKQFDPKITEVFVEMLHSEGGI